MAKLTSEIQFNGSIGNLTVYKMRGVEQPIVRKKGGPSKEKIKKGDNFVNTRRINVEFGGRSTASKWIRRAMSYITTLSDQNLSGPITRLLMPIQKMDQISDWGKRNVVLSRYPQLMAGYNLNINNNFDSIIRNPMTFTLDKNNLSAEVEIPSMIPGFNFFVAGFYPVYRFEIVLGIAPDIYYDETLKAYKPLHDYGPMPMKVIDTEWFPVSKGSPSIHHSLKCPLMPPNDSFSLLLSIGIRYGTVGAGNEIDPLKYHGAGKVLGAV